MFHGIKTIGLTQTSASADSGLTYLIDHVNDIDDLIAFVYPDLASDARMFEKRAVLAMTNVGIDGINDSIPQRLPGPMHTLYGHNTIQGGSDFYTMPEQIHAVNILGIPPHDQPLKVGTMVMFIRNLNFNINAINGRTGVITAIHGNLMEIRLFWGGEPTILVPRITFEGQVSKNSTLFHRHQFPFRIAYAMTVNQSQGQTLHTVGLNFRDDPFSHGQLYVVLSRARGRQHIHCLVQPQRVLDNIAYVANVVFPALLSPTIPSV